MSGKALTAVSLDTVLVQDQQPFLNTTAKNVIILGIRSGLYLRLNNVGSEIWRMFARPSRVSQVCDALFQNYDVEQSTLTREVTQFVESLVQHKLLRVLDGEHD